MSDLISRSALIKRLQEWNRNDDMDKALYNFAMNRVLEQPTVEAKPVVHGEWIETGKLFHFSFKCSICGTIEEFDTNFCPNCGADMRKKVE